MRQSINTRKTNLIFTFERRQLCVIFGGQILLYLTDGSVNLIIVVEQPFSGLAGFAGRYGTSFAYFIEPVISFSNCFPSGDAARSRVRQFVRIMQIGSQPVQRIGTVSVCKAERRLVRMVRIYVDLILTGVFQSHVILERVGHYLMRRLPEYPAIGTIFRYLSIIR